MEKRRPSDVQKQVGKQEAPRLPDSNVFETRQAKVAVLDFERLQQQAPDSIIQKDSAERDPQIGKSLDLMNKMKTFGKKDTARKLESHNPEFEVKAGERSIDDRDDGREVTRFRP